MAYRPREAFCEECKRLYMKKHPCSKRCPECQKAYNKRRQKERYVELAREKAAKKEKDPHVCTRTKTCAYGTVSGATPICDYKGITGHKRPCPVKGCTEYKPKGRKRERAIRNRIDIPDPDDLYMVSDWI